MQILETFEVKKLKPHFTIFCHGYCPIKWLVYSVTGGERCDPEGVALFLVATTGSDLPPDDAVSCDFVLLDPVVLVAELVELAIRKPITTTRLE